tara:strand:- start:234 stop:521 length:288 start_codon:yes stop_codon:yes gene_type:complete
MKVLNKVEREKFREAEIKVRSALDQLFDMTEEHGFDDKAVATCVLTYGIEWIFEVSDDVEQYYRVINGIANEAYSYMSSGSEIAITIENDNDVIH